MLKPSLVGSFSEGNEETEEFPQSSVDMIVDATFVSYIPYLSPSKRSIYTDVSMQCHSAIPLHGTPGISNGQHIDLLIPGGTIVLPGKDIAITYDVSKAKFGIEPGSRYLLFLRYVPGGNFYTLRKSWLISEGRLVANSIPDSRNVEHSRSLHNNMTIDAAMEEIRSRVASSAADVK
ncbi:hypothetical protein FTO74_04840 [Granulicella sp. WH15]|nr:hypothetical protein FTO74_04840 [Granulicella sp. WH15]